jgi:hypothetical protein
MKTRLEYIENELMKYGIIFHDDTGRFLFPDDLVTDILPHLNKLVKDFYKLLDMDI